MDKLFRITAHLEGWSYLLLLGIAMPMKYLWDQPWLIRPLGMAHGFLFIGYVVLVFLVSKEKKWNNKFTIWAYAASLLPIATFLVSRDMDSEKAKSN